MLNGVLDIELTVPDPEPLVEFWERRGLRRTADGVLGSDERPAMLRITEGRYRHLSDLHLGCDTEGDLLDIRRRLADLGIEATIDGNRLLCVTPELGNTVTIDVREQSPLAPFTPRPANGPGTRSRIDARADAVGEETARPPRRLGHVVLGTTRVKDLATFFVDGLGFRISDQVAGGAAVFARCSPDHHNLLLMPSKVPYLNHYAVEMDDVDAVGKAGQATLGERPDASVVGVGRHTVGGNVFWYLRDPSGTTFEFFTDMDQILDDDGWDAHGRRDDWDSTFAVWGPEPPRVFFVPEDLGDIAAGRSAAGLDMTAAVPATGRRAVEAALLDAATAMLAEVGPRGMSVREVAARAGVNHGQVHHYFGSKEALIRAAIRALAEEHFRHAMARAGASGVPPALALAEDERYWKAIIRLALDGEIDIARTEVEDGVSVPRHALGLLAERRGLADPDLDAKTAVAASAALQLGWVALEEFMFVLADVAPDEQEAVRGRIRELASDLYRTGSVPI